MPHTPGHLKRTGRVYNKEEGLSPSSGAGLTGNPNQMQQDQLMGGAGLTRNPNQMQQNQVLSQRNQGAHPSVNRNVVSQFRIKSTGAIYNGRVVDVAGTLFSTKSGVKEGDSQVVERAQIVRRSPSPQIRTQQNVVNRRIANRRLTRPNRPTRPMPNSMDNPTPNRSPIGPPRRLPYIPSTPAPAPSPTSAGMTGTGVNPRRNATPNGQRRNMRRGGGTGGGRTSGGY